MNLIKLKCENCGATLDANKDLEKIICNYCGSEVLIDDDATKLKRLEDVKLKARKDNHEQSLKERKEILEQKLKEKKINEELNSVDDFKKSEFSKILLVFFSFSVLLFFSDTGVLAKVLLFIQAGLFICSWLMGMKIIKEKTQGLRVILAIAAFILIVPIISTSNMKQYEKINWEYIILKEQLPKPNGTKGEIITNDDNTLCIYVKVKSEDKYREYIEACKKDGYTRDMKNETSSFEAVNEEGYKLDIDYDESDKEYRIYLKK